MTYLKKLRDCHYFIRAGFGGESFKIALNKILIGLNLNQVTEARLNFAIGVEVGFYLSSKG